jgi:transposase-like protein
MDEDIKRWTACRKAAVVLEIIQGKTTVSEVSRQFDLTPSEIEEWVDQGKAGMENALKAKPDDIREQYERQLKELQEAYGEAMMELRARKKLQSLLGRDET